MGLLQHLFPRLPTAVCAAGVFCVISTHDLAADEDVLVEIAAEELIELEVEVVGGVEAAVEPDAERPAAEDEEPKVPLAPGPSILADLDFDPSEDRFVEKSAELFLEDEQLAEVLKQIADLDAEDFRARNEASKRLAMVQAPVEHLLGAARDGAGIEMSRRIQGILNVRVKQRRLDALYHAAEKISADQEPGFVGRLLTMASTFDTAHHWDLMRMFELALARSARQQDHGALEAALASDQAPRRELAAFTLGYRSKKDDAEHSQGKLQPGDDLARLAFARGRVAANDRGAGTDLVDLLGSNTLRVRHESATLLRRLHGRDFGFAGYDDKARRDEAAGRWRNFIGGAPEAPEGEPVVLGAGARGTFTVLVGKKPGKEGAVLSFTTSGRKIGDHALASAMGGIDPNNIAFDETADLIVASGGGTEDGRVAVFSSDGVELWNAAGIPAGGGCAAVPGGKLLVAIGNEVEVLDVTGDRTGVWDLGTEIASFARLREGRYLCAHPEDGSVAEYGEGGSILWKQDGFNRPQNVTRLPDGNLLIVITAGEKKQADDQNAGNQGLELIEVTPDGKDVLTRIQPKGVRLITSAARLPNGNTLVGTEKGLAEYTPEGYAVKVWLKTAISSLHVR